MLQTNADNELSTIFADLDGDNDHNFALEALRRLVEKVASERDDISAVIEDVLSPGELNKGYAGAVACHRCGWVGCYSKVGGCEPIADTGDYGEPLCPECNAYIGVEEELLREVYAAIKGRILARIEGRPWPAFPCCFCEKEVTKETGYFTTDYVACKPCEDKHWDELSKQDMEGEPNG